jgi:hypothetical protein
MILRLNTFQSYFGPNSFIDPFIIGDRSEGARQGPPGADRAHRHRHLSQGSARRVVRVHRGRQRHHRGALRESRAHPLQLQSGQVRVRRRIRRPDRTRVLHLANEVSFVRTTGMMDVMTLRVGNCAPAAARPPSARAPTTRSSASPSTCWPR